MARNVSPTGDEERLAYSAPPITEAIVELRYAELSARLVQRLHSKIARFYKNTTQQAMAQVYVLPNLSGADVQNRRDYFRLTSDDQADILIIQPTGLVWARLAPYEGWDIFFERVRRDFSTVAKNLEKMSVDRVGVRYTNRIDIPRGDKGYFHHEEYFTINLPLPDGYNPTTHYVWEIGRIYEDKKLVATIKSSTMEPEIPDFGAFLLDIDIGTVDYFPSHGDDIFDKVAEMRDLKNKIFNDLMTDKAKASFA